MTSKWIRIVQAKRDYTVDWRFISVRMLNTHLDPDTYDTSFYEGARDLHDAGLRLLRVASAVREKEGREPIGRLYAALGARIFEAGPGDGLGRGWQGDPQLVKDALTEAGLSTLFVDFLDDESRDAEIKAETEEALSLTGKDVGTPIVHFQPPEGVAFFGPVISRLPDEEQAVELWDHVVALSQFPGFAELKRSLREQPQLPVFGFPAQ